MYPPYEGGRGMFHRTCDAMRTKHPPSPLRKGEIKVSTSILFPKKIKRALKKRMEGQPANYKYTFRDDEIEIDLISLMVKESRSTISYQMIDRIEFHQNYFKITI